MDDRTTRCIECGGFVSSLNEDDDGHPCPACAERLLETLPGVFHRPWMQPWDLRGAVEAEPGANEFLAGESSEDDWDSSTSFRPFEDLDPDRPA